MKIPIGWEHNDPAVSISGTVVGAVYGDVSEFYFVPMHFCEKKG